MKYARLTKEQLEELQQEFINFLAAQSITGEEWKEIKENKPEAVEQEIDVFSDLIWEGVLNKVSYLENISENQLHLFHLEEQAMSLIAVRVKEQGVNLLSKEGFDWLRANLHAPSVDIMTAQKDYSEDRNLDKFQLIAKGAVITKGELYQWFEQLIATD